MASDLSALIARVEAATGPGRELDAEISKRAGHAVMYWDGEHTARPFTASLDAAVSLVPSGHNWSLDMLCRDGNEARTFYGEHPNEIDTEATGATPALALCAAALKARQAMEGGDHG